MTQYATTMIKRWLAIKRWVALAAPLAALAAAPAEAQFLEAFEENRWGVHVSLTPEWRAPDAFRYLLDAHEIVDWRGSDYSIGFVRGRARGGEWGLALIRQRVKADSMLCLTADGGGGATTRSRRRATCACRGSSSTGSPRSRGSPTTASSWG